MPNVVLDSNVLVSAFASRDPAAPTRRALALARSKHRLCLSGAVVGEVGRVLLRPKFGRYGATPATVAAYLDLLRLGGLVVEPGERVAECRDPDDDRVLELALACSAAAVVSGDADLRALHPWRGVPILSPREFAERDGP